MEDGPPGAGLDKADEVAPLVAVLDRSHWPMPNGRPDTAQDGLKPNAMLVDGPDRYLGLREGRGDLFEEWAELFLKACCSSRLAPMWRGRGTCGLCRSRVR